MGALRRARRGLLVSACAALTALFLAPVPAIAQTAPTTSTTTAENPPSRIELVAQDASTPVGGDVNMRFNITNAPAGARLNFTTHFAVRTRSAFDTTFVAGTLSNDVLGRLSVPLDGVPIDDSGTRNLTLGLQTAAIEADRLNIRFSGVYPVKIELRDEDERIVSNSFVTPLVVSEPGGRPSVAERLRFAWVWPFTAAPSYLPNGEIDPDVLAALQPSGRLGRQAIALHDDPDIPVTIVPGPETMEAWLRAGLDNVSVETGSASVRTPAALYQALGGTYVPIDIPSLLDHGLSAAVDEELIRGNEVFATMVGVTPDARTRLVRPASPAALARLSANGINRVIVDGSALGSSETRPANASTLTTPVRINTPAIGSDSVEALVTDMGLLNFLNADLPPALRAQLLLAGLSVIAIESPQAPKVISVANLDNLDAPTALFAAVLDGLRNNPYVLPVTVAQAFDAVPPESTPAKRDLVTTQSAEPVVFSYAYASQRTRLNSFGAIAAPGDPAVAAADRSILASVSSAWPLDAARSRAARHLATVDRLINGFVSLIEVPDTRTITLTSRSGEIPLTFRNETGYTVRLRAALSSDKLTFPAGSVIEFDLPPKSSTVRVAVETRTSGTFPINLEVTSIDGVLPISQRRLEVRSTFVSTVGIVLMVSAVAFLAVWWGWDLRRRRRRKPQTVARRTRTVES